MLLILFRKTIFSWMVGVVLPTRINTYAINIRPIKSTAYAKFVDDVSKFHKGARP